MNPELQTLMPNLFRQTVQIRRGASHLAAASFGPFYNVSPKQLARVFAAVAPDQLSWRVSHGLRIEDYNSIACTSKTRNPCLFADSGSPRERPSNVDPRSSLRGPVSQRGPKPCRLREGVSRSLWASPGSGGSAANPGASPADPPKFDRLGVPPS